MSLIEYFPKDAKARKSQIEIINKIDDAFKRGKKFIICSAPTGSGKSFLAKTLANASKSPSSKFQELINSYDAFIVDYTGDYKYAGECLEEPLFGGLVLTISKSLQDQYGELFTDGEKLKGKINYTCAINNTLQVEYGPCVYLPKQKKECWEKNKCPYYNQRNKMLTSKFGILNYSMFLALPDHVKQREYLVCDEASELEDELVKKFSRVLPYKLIKRIMHTEDVTGIPVTDYNKFYTWLSTFNNNLFEQINQIKKDLAKKKTIPQVDLQRLSLYNQYYMSLSTTMETWDKCEYVIETDENNIKLTPLKVSYLSQFLFQHAEKVLLMSATIIDHAQFARTLGIKDYEYIEVDSTFDPSKAPIIMSNKYRLNFGNIKELLPTLAKEIQQICDYHKDHKGIIHTHTMFITEFLERSLKGNRFLYRKPGQDNVKIINDHLNTVKSTVLVSPSMSMGVDLKDDLARFQIIVKAAYAPLGDTRIKKLANEDRDWYQNKMLSNVVQQCGRGVRNENDSCVTYIIDAAITDAVTRNKTKLPKYFIDRIK